MLLFGEVAPRRLRTGAIKQELWLEKRKMTQCSFDICFKRQSLAISHRNKPLEVEENGCLMSGFNLLGYCLLPINRSLSKITEWALLKPRHQPLLLTTE